MTVPLLFYYKLILCSSGIFLPEEPLGDFLNKGWHQRKSDDYAPLAQIREVCIKDGLQEGHRYDQDEQ